MDANSHAQLETLARRVDTVTAKLDTLLEHCREIRAHTAQADHRLEVLERRVEGRMAHVEAKVDQILEILRHHG